MVDPKSSSRFIGSDDTGQSFLLMFSSGREVTSFGRQSPLHALLQRIASAICEISTDARTSKDCWTRNLTCELGESLWIELSKTNGASRCSEPNYSKLESPALPLNG
jgi:hypothetical protein